MYVSVAFGASSGMSQSPTVVSDSTVTLVCVLQSYPTSACPDAMTAAKIPRISILNSDGRTSLFVSSCRVDDSLGYSYLNFFISILGFCLRLIMAAPPSAGTAVARSTYFDHLIGEEHPVGFPADVSLAANDVEHLFYLAGAFGLYLSWLTGYYSDCRACLRMFLNELVLHFHGYAAARGFRVLDFSQEVDVAHRKWIYDSFVSYW